MYKVLWGCALVHQYLHSHYHRPPKLITKVDGKVSFHPKSVNSDEYTFRSKFLIYYTKMKSSQVYIHDATEIPPFPLLFFGGDISVERDGDQETIAVDKWIVFQAPTHIAELVKVLVFSKLFSCSAILASFPVSLLQFFMSLAVVIR